MLFRSAQAPAASTPGQSRAPRPAQQPAATPLLASLRPALPAPFSAPNAALGPTASIAPARPGPGAVQVVSSSNEAETRQALASLQRRFAELQGLQPHVQAAQVRGRTVYRGVITGFASRDKARAFCQTLKRGGRDCLAR